MVDNILHGWASFAASGWRFKELWIFPAVRRSCDTIVASMLFKA